MICGPDFETFFTGTILPLVAYSTIVTSILIGLSYMAGNVLSNPKLTLWSRTELVQLFISVATALFIPFVVNSFCLVHMDEVDDLFDVGGSVSGNVYSAAEDYLSGAALYSHHAMQMTRYHLQAYTIMAYANVLKCEGELDDTGLGLTCFFGQGSNSYQPLGGYGAITAALNFALNSTMMSFFSAMNFLFILMFVYRGFVFLFLPLGVFLRSMPYMRPFGSLMFAVALSFLIVYPFMLAVFGMMGDTLLDKANDYAPEGVTIGDYDEKIFKNEEEGASVLGASFLGDEYIHDLYLEGKEDSIAAIGFAATAFIAAVFFPTLAMLAAMASVGYVARLYGDEIDLSRLTQLV